MSYSPRNPNGQATMANSSPVVLASDQSAVPVSVASLPLPTGAAQDGTDGTSPPAVLGAGTGIRGWLRSIYEKLTGNLAVTGTFWQATQPVSIAATVPVSIGSMPTTPVTGTFFQATQPVSATTLPLPTGAATSAKQPALGTAGAASADVISVQGIAGGVAQPTALVAGAPATTAMQAAAVAVGNGATLDVNGFSTSIIELSGVFVATVTFEASIDDVSWTVISAVQAGTNNIASTATTIGLYRMSTGGLKSIRARISAYTSGSVTANGRSVVSATTPKVVNLASTATVALSAGANVIGGVTQSGTWNIGSITTLPALATGANVIGAVTQSGTWNIGSITTIPSLVAGTAYVGKVRQTDGTLDLTLLNAAPGSDTGQVSIPVRIVSSLAGGSGGTSIADAAAFTRGTTTETPAGGVAETAAPSLTTGKAAALSLNLSGGLRVDGSGVTQPTSAPDATASGTITTQNLVPAGVATAGSAVEITLGNGQTCLTIQTTGTYTGGLSVQATVDGSTWVTQGFQGICNTNTGVSTAAIASATQSIFTTSVTGFIKARVTGLAAMTGTVTVTLRAAQGMPIEIAAIDTIRVLGIITAGSNLIADVGQQYRASATGAATLAKILSAATTNATSVKASAGRVLGWALTNTTAVVKAFHIHNKASPPTVGTDSPGWTIILPANGYVQYKQEGGIAMATGIAYSITGAIGDLDATAVAVGDVIGVLLYA